MSTFFVSFGTGGYVRDTERVGLEVDLRGTDEGRVDELEVGVLTS